MALKALSGVTQGASRFTRLPNGFTRSSKLTQTLPIDGVNKATIRVVIGTTAVGTGVFNRSATTGITIGVTASGQQTDQQHFGTATVGVVISSTASASVTSTHSGTATASIVITTTAAGETGATHSGTANIGVAVTASADGNAISTHSGVASVQVNLSASAGASSYDPLTEVPDESGENNVMVLNGSPTFTTTAAIGTKSVDFDGTNDYGEVDDTFQSLIRSSNFSISAWVQFHVDSVTAPILSISTSPSPDDRLQFHRTNNNYIQFTITSDGDSRSLPTATGTLTGSSTWYHVVVTVGSNNNNYPDIKAYIDGSLSQERTDQDLQAIDLSQYTSSLKLEVGRLINSAGNFYFNGLIDDISIWDKELSSTEVSNLYNSGSGTDLSGSSNLAGWWKMGDSNIVTHSGTATVSVAVTTSASGIAVTTHSGTASCQVNLSASASGSALFESVYSLDFDGTDDYVEISDHDDLSFGNSSTDSAFTIAGWVKLDSTSLQRFVTKSTSSSAEYIFGTGGGSNLLLALYDDTTSVVRYRLSSGTLSTGTWTHVAVTHSGGTIKLFINGSEDSGTSGDIGSYTAMHNSTGTVRLGAYENGSQYTNGKLDELAIWDEALTSAEITAMYNSGSPLNLATDSGNYASSANLTAWWRLENNTNDSSGNGHNGTVNSSPTFSTDAP